MKTHTFYSYKGGLGRSLLVANMAFAWARLGAHVYVMDLDLEAPGMHHKMAATGTLSGPCMGIVESLGIYLRQDKPVPVADLCSRLTPIDDIPGSITLIPAVSLDGSGKPLYGRYIRDLTSLDWSELLLRKDGVLLFMNMQAQLAQEGRADVLLVDARTGVTQIGGVATAALADTITALTNLSEESLTGLGNVIQALANSPRPGNRELECLTPVLARVPRSESRQEESERLLTIEQRFAQPESRVRALAQLRAAVLHEDPRLASGEYVPMADLHGDPSLLRMDYLRLLRHLAPEEPLDALIEPITQHLLASGKVELRARVAQTVEMIRIAASPSLYSYIFALLDEYPTFDSLSVVTLRLATGLDYASAAVRLAKLLRKEELPRPAAYDELAAALALADPLYGEGLRGDSLTEWLVTVADCMESELDVALLYDSLRHSGCQAGDEVLGRGLVRFPDSGPLLLRYLEVQLDLRDASGALASLGPPSAWVARQKSVSPAMGQLIAAAALIAEDRQWAHAVWDSEWSRSLPRAQLAALLCLIGKEEEAVVMAAAVLATDGRERGIADLEFQRVSRGVLGQALRTLYGARFTEKEGVPAGP